MSNKFLTALKLGVAAVTMLFGIGIGTITGKAAFEAPYYNININGGSFDGTNYVLGDGTVVKNAFFCDGTYTYFLQADGTPMKDKLTYHPDGEHVIYFDANGHECFDTFAHVKTNIEGKPVDDLCYFGTTGNLYVNVLTYNKEGTALYYANPYGVMERYGVFQLDTNAVNYSILANGYYYGYANSNGEITGFYTTYEEAAGIPTPEEPEVEGSWEYFGYVTYDANGNQLYRTYYEGNNYYVYTTVNGKEYLSEEEIDYYDVDGRYCGYKNKEYSLKEDGTTYLSCEKETTFYEGKDKTYYSKDYDEAGNITYSTVQEYNGSLVDKEVNISIWSEGNSKRETVINYNYVDGKLASEVEVATYTYANGNTYVSKSVTEYDASEFPIKTTEYDVKDGKEKVTLYQEYLYTIVNGKQVLARSNTYSKGNSQDRLLNYNVYGYDDYGNRVSSIRYYCNTADGDESNASFSGAMEAEFKQINNRWKETKYLNYKSENGQRVPSYGYEYVYDDNDRKTKYISYTGKDGQWVISRYTVYNQGELPASGTKDQVTQLEYSRSYDGNSVCTEYTVDFYKYVVE